MIHNQFARMVKRVDLRYSGSNSAWVLTPQLTIVFYIRIDVLRD
jgi:hypothetical protein